jgi:putative membrane protein
MMKVIVYWLEPWEPSPTVVVAVLIAAVLFTRGARRARVSFARRAAFWLGLAGIYIALHTRLDYSGIPFNWRQRWMRPAMSTRAVRVTLDVLFNPVVAVTLFVGLIYFWLLSPIHFKAMLDYRLYRAMNWSMVIDGLLFWWLILDSRPAPPARLAPGRRILIVIAAIPPQILLGAYIFFTPHELYPIYSICGRAFTWISPAHDQQIGGLLLWIPGSMMSVIGALVALRHWLRLSARSRLARERGRRAAPAVA